MNLREERGRTIASLPNQITRIDEHSYKVRSQSSNGEYGVLSTERGWICSCPDFMFRPSVERCKHVWSVLFSQELRKRVENEVTIKSINTLECIYCHSKNIRRKSIRHNKSGDLRRYLCLGCGDWFSFNLGFEGMKASPQVITSAMQLYFSGESFGGVKNFLSLQGVSVSRQTVYNWIKKYVGLMKGYLEKITPRVSDTWRTDELYVKIKGNMKYLFAMMDDETRFRIARQVADHKGTSDVRPMFQEAKERADKKPNTLISDGAHNFHEAYLKEFWTLKGPRTQHIQEIRMNGEVHNNKMERQNGEVRDREKVMRGLKNDDSPVIDGMQLFHNYFRPHMALDGKTPAEACGIKIEGQNKWQTVIQNASLEPTLYTKNLEPST